MQSSKISLLRNLPTRAIRVQPAWRYLSPIVSARSYASSTDSPDDLSKTPLYDFHLANEGKLVPFAGFAMPLSYGSDGGASLSHTHVRTKAGLFDVSHMVQTYFRGPSAREFLESITPSDLKALPPFSGSLSVLLNDKGGIVDDTIITKHENDETFYVVTNAGRRAEDLHLFKEKIQAWEKAGKGKVEMEVLDGWGLVALQGPKAAEILQSLTSTDLSTLYFGQSTFIEISGVKVHVARGGYTGEDGFEISLPPAETVRLTTLLKEHEDVKLTGLGPRDSLRLEAGMCLYGHDLDESVSPVEAGLSWVIGKGRREAADFPGASIILAQLASPSTLTRRRVGLLSESGPPFREGSLVFPRLPKGSDVPPADQAVGVVTSGIPGVSLKKNIGMGYLKKGSWKKGTEISIQVRKKLYDGVVAGMPFVPTGYYKKP
ncbi:glycine cleavage system t protein [Phaffia rhodozyma]|uniref:Aminomethyltransferase n=1 Tax=Phaffia rhodozyma TaxID=264483 RepID=A0A0F7SR62_PHARH|nr:glycine cleavage system t protein [Phaffia rhodozyma]